MTPNDDSGRARNAHNLPFTGQEVNKSELSLFALIFLIFPGAFFSRTNHLSLAVASLLAVLANLGNHQGCNISSIRIVEVLVCVVAFDAERNRVSGN